ncbi:hypothetical protein OH77DRAFT_493774 [Trametes cingulata]|nr:hypothetical protein OH77DRAFT_493774 [Trametes cingulata]
MRTRRCLPCSCGRSNQIGMMPNLGCQTRSSRGLPFEGASLPPASRSESQRTCAVLVCEAHGERTFSDAVCLFGTRPRNLHRPRQPCPCIGSVVRAAGADAGSRSPTHHRQSSGRREVHTLSTDARQRAIARGAVRALTSSSSQPRALASFLSSVPRGGSAARSAKREPCTLSATPPRHQNGLWHGHPPTALPVSRFPFPERDAPHPCRCDAAS